MNESFTLINKTVLLIAKRNSGKSQLLKYLVTCEKDEYDEIFVICPTENVKPFYNKITDPDNIFETYDDEWMDQLIQQMTRFNANKPENKQKHVLLILDDCISDVDFKTCKAFKKVFTRGRHVNISLILTTQYMNSIPPVARSNCDYIFVGQLTSQGIELLSDEFRSGTLSKKEFVDMYHRCTVDYYFLLINNTSVKNNEVSNLYAKIKTPKEYL